VSGEPSTTPFLHKQEHHVTDSQWDPSVLIQSRRGQEWEPSPWGWEDGLLSLGFVD
jgi:hypothetical protein